LLYVYFNLNPEFKNNKTGRHLLLFHPSLSNISPPIGFASPHPTVSMLCLSLTTTQISREQNPKMFSSKIRRRGRKRGVTNNNQANMAQSVAFIQALDEITTEEISVIGVF